MAETLGFSFTLYQASTRPFNSSNVHALFVYALINFTVGSILWYFVGYSLSFGPSQKGLIGSLDDAFFLGVSGSNCSVHADSVPGILFASFEMMLAVIPPFMLLSAWAEQMNILGALTIFILWPIFVYYPLTHWIRGEGWLQHHFGIVDQSGSLTIHASTGSSALVFTKVFNGVHENQTHKQEHKKEKVHPPNVYLLAGGLITSLGWYCTNVGSVHKFNGAAILSLINCDLSICASLLSWLIVMYVTKKSYRMTDLLQGIIVGLVGVSASSGSIELWASMINGLILGLISSVVSWCVQKYQPLWTSTGVHDITYIHGVPGILGAVTAGLFTKSSKDVTSANGAFYSNGSQLGVQLLGVVITTMWSVLWTYSLIWLIRVTVGLDLDKKNKMFGAYDTANSLPSSVISSDREVLHKRLFKVAAKGDLQELDNLHVQQVSFGVQDFDKRTPLHVACMHGNLSCVKFLLRQPGVDNHARDRWKASPLSEAVQFGHNQVVQCLLRHGAGWCEDGVGDLLCSAIVVNDVEELQRLVSLGVDVNAPNEDGGTALHVAAAVGSRGVVHYLTDHRADINAVDSLGNTPLNYSNMHEHLAVSQLLEGLGAKRLSHHYSTHEICEVATTGNLQMLRHMVHNGATVCYRDFNKRTPLHVSAAEGHLDVVKFLLLQPGININARDTNDFSPLLDAIVNGHHGVVQYLKARGGTISECKLASMMTNAASTGDTRTM
ncbi:ammonium transporter 1-like isoform X2 [Stylophora pistillata]|uniref:ammonium transporter 1-like isoform X2 n=1 Tax=Stylophora pistillata TaxID=50429 RepID=UPI000C0561EC|nr:ammonium transporter 1-like isoform X2 [Stylophora pistillata]